MPEIVAAQLKAIAFSNIQQLAEGFIDRTWVLNKIDHWLEQKDQQFLVIAGELGIGKSTLAAHLIQTREDIVAYHLCQAAKLETLKLERILRSPSKTISLSVRNDD
jgi:ABC-type phosphate/phosphonate transport system ATPase subunit